jgi:hypothetical protein
MPPAVAFGVGGLASLGGAALGASAAGSAADKQAASAAQANNLQSNMFQQQQAAYEPWRQAGLSALYGPGGMLVRQDGGTGVGQDAANLQAKKDAFIAQKLNEYNQEKQGILDKYHGFATKDTYDQINAAFSPDELQKKAQDEWASSPDAKQEFASSKYMLDPSLTRAFSMDDFQKDPGYDFRMQEGQKALERSAAAKGGLMGGGFGKALSRYGQDYASNEYQNAYNRFNNDQGNRFNRLSALSGLGQTANAQIGQAGQNYANQVGNNYTGLANAQGAAGVAQSNALGNGLSGLAQAGMGYAANQQQQNWMDQWSKNQQQNLLLGGTKMGGQSNLSSLVPLA